MSFITNKLLGFTEVDRIAAPVHMYPERFMTTERILKAGSCPDIDFNVADAAPFAKAQQEVLGKDHAYPMLAYGTMLTSAAWKLYAKAQEIPYEIANEVSNQIKRYELAVKHADEDEKADIDVYNYISPQYKDVFEGSKGYRGIISSWSIAPCAYLLYAGSIRKEIGLVRIKDNLCCCMDGHWAERNHFLKNDQLIVKVWDLIYRIFHRLGSEPPSVAELLRWCESDEKPWDLYKRGATLCLNQVEKKGTSARVAKYQPRNISELSAFIAAIRPGFASMFSTFASRVPFSYGVKAFDNLIQTKEMPNSYVLYQEQEMQALHYAGIPMSECYTAIKNIAKKRKEKVLAYKDVFKKGFTKAIVEDEGKSEEEADELTNKLWQIIEDSASYLFNSSHAYCVALDSLYEAWLKANHPLEFYEVALNLYEQKGDKDKVAALKEEAEKYFDILFPPMRYGQDNRQMRADPVTNSIVNSLGSIKGMSKAMGAKLYECAQQNHKSFFDVLKWLDERSIKSAKVIPLVKIDYFNSFGNNVELLRLITWWDFFKQGTAKTISKDKLSPAFEEMLAHYASDKSVKGEPLKSYKINDMDGLLKAIEEYVFSLHLEELPYRVKAANQNEILGYVDMTTQKEEDRRKLYLLDVRPLIGKWNAGKPWKYVFHCKSVGSGKVSQLSVTPYRYNNTIAKALKGDIILAKHVHKNEKGYRNYKKDFVHMFDDIFKKSQSIRYIGDRDNANSDSALVPTQRSLIYSELNKSLYKKFFLNQDELDAAKDGYIYIHDMSARLDSINCCLFDMGNVVRNGFEMGNVWYNEPKTLDVAFDVISDITISAAACQYGGFTIPRVDTVLAPYAEKSFDKYVAEYCDIAHVAPTDENAQAYGLKKVRRDFEQGFQSWEYRFNTVGSSRGDYPFIAISFGIDTSRFGLMASEMALKVRAGGQGKPGHKKPVLFPKLTFLYDEELHGKGKPYEWLFDIAVDCSSKTMYPDYLSLTGDGYIPSIYKKYGKPISLMGCRASLSPWYERGGMKPADDADVPIFEGRFNLGAISLNLPMILAKARQESKNFYEVLDCYLELIRSLHKKTFDYLGEKKASTNPLGFCQGGFLGGTLDPDDKIRSLLAPMTMSFGITALNELQELYNGKSLVEDGQFALDVMKYINQKVTSFKEEDGILYAIYGTPAESLAGLQVKQFRKKYGIVHNVSDRPYVSNSFHCGVWEKITPIEKQDLEERFWDYFNGGKIQYCRYPVSYNKEAIKTLIRRAMQKGFYEGVNLSLSYCEECGYEQLDMDVCPKCGSSLVTKIDRMNGYLGYTRIHGKTRYNDSKNAEIKDRVSM